MTEQNIEPLNLNQNPLMLYNQVRFLPEEQQRPVYEAMIAQAEEFRSFDFTSPADILACLNVSKKEHIPLKNMYRIRRATEERLNLLSKAKDQSIQMTIQNKILYEIILQVMDTEYGYISNDVESILEDLANKISENLKIISENKEIKYVNPSLINEVINADDCGALHDIATQVKQKFYDKIAYLTGWETINQQSVNNVESVLLSNFDSISVYENGELNPIYKKCEKWIKKIGGKQRGYCINTLLENSAIRAATEILKGQQSQKIQNDFLEQNKTPEDIMDAFQTKIANYFKKSLIGAVLITRSESFNQKSDNYTNLDVQLATMGNYEKFFREQVDDHVGEKEKSPKRNTNNPYRKSLRETVLPFQDQHPSAAYKHMQYMLKKKPLSKYQSLYDNISSKKVFAINPLAVDIDSYYLDYETRRDEKILQGKRIDLNSFQKKLNKHNDSLINIAEKFFYKGRWVDVLASQAALVTTIALTVSGHIALPVLICAGRVFTKYTLGPLYHRLQDEMYRKNNNEPVTSITSKLKYIKNNWQNPLKELNRAYKKDQDLPEHMLLDFLLCAPSPIINSVASGIDVLRKYKEFKIARAKKITAEKEFLRKDKPEIDEFIKYKATDAYYEDSKSQLHSSVASGIIGMFLWRTNKPIIDYTKDTAEGIVEEKDSIKSRIRKIKFGVRETPIAKNIRHFKLTSTLIINNIFSDVSMIDFEHKEDRNNKNHIFYKRPERQPVSTYQMSISR